MTATQQRTYYRQQHIKRMSLYNYCYLAAKRALRQQMKPALAAVRRGESTEAVIHTIRTEPIEEGLTAIYTKVVPVFANLTYKQLLPQKSDADDLLTKKGFFETFLDSQWVAQARYYVSTVATERIRKITETTRNKVRQFLDDAVAEGWSINRTATELSAYTQALNKSRAVVVARTELISSSSFGSLQGAKATRLKLNKVWLAAKDSRVRHSHITANGQKVDIDLPFFVNGERLLHPGDTTNGASASNVVNCRCALTFEPKK